MKESIQKARKRMIANKDKEMAKFAGKRTFPMNELVAKIQVSKDSPTEFAGYLIKEYATAGCRVIQKNW